MSISKKHKFDIEAQEIAAFARVLSHPARVEILRFLARTKTCISGDISNEIPLSRTTVSQHLQELKKSGLIHGEIDGLKINYCLCKKTIERCGHLFGDLFDTISVETTCSPDC